jgi:hypothetical protein
MAGTPKNFSAGLVLAAPASASGPLSLRNLTSVDVGVAYRAGQQAISTLATSQAVSFSAALPSTNYAVHVTPIATLVAAVSFGVSNKTVNGFTITLSSGISGGVTVDYLAVLNN